MVQAAFLGQICKDPVPSCASFSPLSSLLTLTKYPVLHLTTTVTILITLFLLSITLTHALPYIHTSLHTYLAVVSPVFAQYSLPSPILNRPHFVRVVLLLASGAINYTKNKPLTSLVCLSFSFLFIFLLCFALSGQALFLSKLFTELHSANVFPINNHLFSFKPGLFPYHVHQTYVLIFTFPQKKVIANASHEKVKGQHLRFTSPCACIIITTLQS